ncbi:MAG: SDR family NAD(P)-dependent oxidoreductase, partial [Rhodospirillaceae bacterium]
MTKPLKNKIAIITGGGRGLGKAMAIGLAKAGASGLCITGSSSVDQLKQVAREIKSLDTNTKVLPVIADVTNPDACLKAANQACRALGP